MTIPPGPVAKTYDELQSLPSLRNAIEAIDEKRVEERFLVALMQALYVAAKNIELLGQYSNRAATEGSWNRLATWTTWIVSFSRIQLTLAHHLVTETTNLEPGPLEIAPSFHEAIRPGTEAVRTVDRYLFAKMREVGEETIRRKLATFETSPILTTLQNHKQASLIARELMDTTVYFFGGMGSIAGLPGREHLDLAVVGPPGPEGETLFSAFRALHQIPELLGLIALSELEEFMRLGPLNARATRSLSIAKRAMEVASECLVPLSRDLNVAQYHQIRDHLGKTSGSQSETLARRLFKRDLTSVGQVLKSQIDNDNNSLDRNVVAEFAGMRSAAIRWRAEHLHLPRNVLGGFGSTSLIGSPDAVLAVDAMFDGAKKHDPFIADPSPSKLASHSWEAEAEALRQTSQLTIRRFPDVQDRTRKFSDE